MYVINWVWNWIGTTNSAIIRLVGRGILLIISLSLFACNTTAEVTATNDDSNPDIDLSEDSMTPMPPTLTVTSISSPVVGQTPTSGATGTPPTFADTDLLPIRLSNDDTQCAFPCVYNLRVGQSSETDVREFFHETVGLEQDYDVFADYLHPILTTSLPSGYYGAAHVWHSIYDESQEDKAGSFGITFIHEQQTELLTAIKLAIDYSLFSQNFTPQDVLSNLGEPTEIYYRFAETEQVDVLRGTLIIIYEEGFTFEYPEFYMRINEQTDSPEFCIDDSTWNEKYNATTVTVRIFPPFDEPTALMYSQFRGLNSLNNFSSIEEFDVDLQELAQMATSNTQMCLFP